MGWTPSVPIAFRTRFPVHAVSLGSVVKQTFFGTFSYPLIRKIPLDSVQHEQFDKLIFEVSDFQGGNILVESVHEEFSPFQLFL